MKPEAQTKVMSLPIFQNFDRTDITIQGKNVLDKFRKGEFSIYTILRLAIAGAVGYLSWVYILPPIFRAVGQLLAVAATGVLILFLIFLAPVIFKMIRRLTRAIHKAAIKYDPFGELEDQRQKMLANQETFKKAKGKIQKLKQDMETEAGVSEKNAKELQKDILINQGKAEKLKLEMQKMENANGKAAKGTDEYVQKNAELMKTLSEAQRQGHLLEQASIFVSKYGARANVMKNFGQKLVLVETAMEIKIKDFDATIQILKKDYEFAAKSREATETAKSAMGFSKGWELDYALDVVTSTIAEDIAITTGNLSDINSLTANFDMDSDEMFARLDTLANEIKVGANIVPEAKQYSNPDYVLTHDDKVNSGGFGEMFN